MGFHNAGGHKRTMKNLQWAASLGAEALARSIKNTPLSPQNTNLSFYARSITSVFQSKAINTEIVLMHK